MFNQSHVNIVIIGHLDHGKSTLIGRLLLDTNSLPKEKLSEIKRVSRELGAESELAFLTDQLREEREQNRTIDTTQTFFKTRKRNYVIIDAPGHAEFIKNMITGASLAQAAILIIDAQEGIREQSRRHAYIIKLLGIEKVITVLNKMDLVNYAEEKFRELKNESGQLLNNLGIAPSFILPISAKEGENISLPSAKMPWCQGPCLLGALDSLKPDKKPRGGNFRFCVQDNYEISGEKIAVGRIASGKIRQGQEVVILPSLKQVKVNSIRVFGKQLKQAGEGENIGLTFAPALSAGRGTVIASPKGIPRTAGFFKANIFWLSQEPLTIGKPMILRCATQEVGCVVQKIEKRIDSALAEGIIETDARELKTNEAGVVILKTQAPLVMEEFFAQEELGKFILESGYNLCAAGTIKEVLA